MEPCDEPLVGLLATKRRPRAGLVEECAAKLEQRGWRRDIAGDENFEKGAKAWAYAIANDMGLIVLGPKGTGKTSFLTAVTLGHAHRNMLCTYDLKTQAGRELLKRCTGDECLADALRHHAMIDDLGAETKVNVYGVMVEPAFDFILTYVSCGKGKLYISTNLCGKGDEPNSFSARYSDRSDCLKEAVVPVFFMGKSVRRWLLPL